jgi:PAS domain S-box-containing protein
MRTGQPMVIEDVSQSDLFRGAPELDVLLAAGVRAVTSVPLHTRKGRLVGVLSTHFPAPTRPEDSALHLLKVLACQAADAIEREEGAHALRESHNLLAAILDQATDAIVVRDAEGRVILANAEARRWAQAPPDGTPLVVAPDIWGPSLDAEGRPVPLGEWPVSKALRGERATGVEFHRVAEDGTTSVLLNSAGPLRDARGQVIGAVSVNHDITSQKGIQAELQRTVAALRVAEERWRLLFARSPVPMVLSTLEEGRILEMNEACCATLGYRPMDVVGRCVTEFGLWQDPGDRARWAAALGLQGAVREMEASFLTRSGDRRLGLVFSECVESGGGPAVLSVVLDVTEQEHAKRVLAAQKALLETVVEQAADAIVVFDARGRVVMANASARAISGGDPRAGTRTHTAALLGVRGEEACPTSADEGPVERALRGEPCFGQEVQIPRSRRSFLLSALPLRDEREAIAGAIATLADISHLRRALDDRDLALRETKHRLRNNLQILASLLAMQSEAATTEETRTALEESRSRVFSMAHLQDHLAPGQGRAPVRLGRYLQAVVDSLRESYGRAGIRVTVMVEDVVLDHERANTVGLLVTELLTNAFKYAFPDGRPGEIAVGLRADGDGLELQVRDTGCGLPPDLDPRRAASLGLRIVHLLVQRLRATVGIERQPGATFRIRFPVNPEE